MSEKFQNKYRIPSARLLDWDYRTNALYFVTICTKNRQHSFGEITDGAMILSETGEICEKYLLEIPTHFPFVLLDSSVVMPNHLHAIIVINNPESWPRVVETLHCVETLQCNVSTGKMKNTIMSDISPKPGSLSTIIRSFKSAVSKDAHLIDADFCWQSRFHDHIIRNHESYLRIKNYIETNPKNWHSDKFYT